jgi:hypothetical protein
MDIDTYRPGCGTIRARAPLWVPAGLPSAEKKLVPLDYSQNCIRNTIFMEAPALSYLNDISSDSHMGYFICLSPDAKYDILPNVGTDRRVIYCFAYLTTSRSNYVLAHFLHSPGGPVARSPHRGRMASQPK